MPKKRDTKGPQARRIGARGVADRAYMGATCLEPRLTKQSQEEPGTEPNA